MKDKVSKTVENENETRRLKGEKPLEGDALKKFKKRVASNMDVEPSKTCNFESNKIQSIAQPSKKRTIPIITNQLSKTCEWDDFADSINKQISKTNKNNLVIPSIIDDKQQHFSKIVVVKKFNINNSINHQLSDSYNSTDDENEGNPSFFIKQSKLAFKKIKFDKSEMIERNRIRSLILNTGKLDADNHQDQIEVLVDQELQKNVFAKLINNNKIINKQQVIIPSSLTLTHQTTLQQSQNDAIPSTNEAIEILDELNKNGSTLVETNTTTKQRDRFSNAIDIAFQTIENMEQDLKTKNQIIILFLNHILIWPTV